MKDILLKGAILSSGVIAGALITRYLNNRLWQQNYKDHTLPQCILLHYGKNDEQLNWKDGPTSGICYPKKCIDILIEHCKPKNMENALDVGCGVGRCSFEMSKYFKHVDAFDLNKKFVNFCNKIKADKIVDYSVIKEGDIMDNYEAHLPDDCNPERVHFFVGDACKNINAQCDSELKKYDCVIALNLIDRLTEPLKFFSQLSHLVSDGGVVMVSSPYTWLKEYTTKNNWLGGKLSANGNIYTTTRDTIVNLMNSVNFDLIFEDDIPMVIRETARKYQWTMEHALVFRKQLLASEQNEN